MTGPHRDGCVRGAWLVEQLATRKLWAVFCDAFLSLGPACSCPPSEASTVQPLNSRPV